MNAELLLEHFHRLGEAAGAIPRLRALIIDLAVKGKLTASECSTADAARTARALKLGMSKIVDAIQCTRWTASSEVQTEEERFDAPTGWHWARLNDTGLYVNGVAFKPSDWQAEGMPIIRIQNLSNPSAAINYTTGEYDEANLAPPGTLLVSWSATLDAFIWERETAVVNQHIFRVFPNGAALDKRFLYWLLKDAIKILEAGEDMRGLTMRHIRRGPFLEFPVAIPPLPEQQRIVAKVEELMALCDRLEAAQQQREAERTRLTAAAWHTVVQAEAPADVSFALEQLPALTTRPAQVKALRQTILDLAVRGRLVEQDEGDEPAEVLLERIRREKERLVQEGKVKKEKPGVPDIETPFALPSGWSLARMEDLTELITKGSSPKWQGVAYVEKEAGVLFITSENVGSYRLRKLDELKYVEKKFNEIEPRSILRYGDILVNLVGASIGRTAIYDLHDEANINQAVAIIRLVTHKNQVSRDFLLHYLNSSVAIAHMLASRVVTAQPNMSLTDVRDFPVPIPPLAEQRRIVAKVEELMALCDGLEAALEAGEALRGKVLEAVVRGDAQQKKYEEPEGELRMTAEP